MKVKCIIDSLTDIQVQGPRFATAIAHFYDDDTNEMLPQVIDIDIPLTTFKNQNTFQANLKTLTIARAQDIGYTIASQDITSLI